MKTPRFDFHPTPLTGLWVIQRKPIADERGFFCRFFCAEEFQAAGLKKPVAQINHTHTVKKGAVRGFHFQYPPYAECKIVSCLRGEVLDVAVDIRKGSPTFLYWHGEILSAANQKSLLIPEGFAHGFQALAENCEMIYFHTAPFNGEAEGDVHAQDPRLSIPWPEPIVELSSRDAAIPLLDAFFAGVKV
ncbi:MAG: dTDP-4-dehydrorhamnose 3,5-epimerase family protein [Syntrophales bacterium LBB04]|nr:dTDP-4-dehydrorhamnose 3,5-epimerase family protein [Syntrophales bacterium LBB04]